jgi:hypothetical protein
MASPVTEDELRYNCLSVSGYAMNGRKEPQTLQDTAYRKISEIVRDVAFRLTQKLNLADMTSWNTWLQDIRTMEKECSLVRHKLASLPLPFLANLVPSAVQEFAKHASTYHRANCRPPVQRIMDKKVHDICENLLKVVLLPCIYRADLSFTKSRFAQGLLIKLLYLIPNIKVLIMPSEQDRNNVQLLLEMIPILTDLEEFHFHVGCTTEIIIELSKYCLHLKTIYVQHSFYVGDACVKYLLKLRHLQNLNFANTSLSNNSYIALLSALPRIREVNWLDPIDYVLRNVTSRLHSVTEFNGRFLDAKLLVQKCPNIKQLILHSLREDISGLLQLREVVSLSIDGCVCTLISFGDLMKHFGTSLTKLEMNRADNLKMDDIINYCSVLNSLTVSHCRVISAEISDHGLPHFQNLKELRLLYNIIEIDFSSLLHLYVNLNVFSVEGMMEVTDTFIMKIVMAGGFRNLTECALDICGRLSMDTAWLVMQNCHDLTKLGNLKRWSAVTNEELLELLNYLRNNNVALTVIC